MVILSVSLPLSAFVRIDTWMYSYIFKTFHAILNLWSCSARLFWLYGNRHLFTEIWCRQQLNEILSQIPALQANSNLVALEGVIVLKMSSPKKIILATSAMKQREPHANLTISMVARCPFAGVVYNGTLVACQSLD